MNNDIKIIIDNPNEVVEIIDPNNEINVTYEEDNPIKIDMSDKINLIRITDYHNELQNLDYEHSGHTGFASEEELNILKKNVILKDFSTLSIIPNDYDKSQAYVYIDYNNTSNKISISNIVDKKIRTVVDAPSDWKNNEYIFEEVK